MSNCARPNAKKQKRQSSLGRSYQFCPFSPVADRICRRLAQDGERENTTNRTERLGVGKPRNMNRLSVAKLCSSGDTRYICMCVGGGASWFFLTRKLSECITEEDSKSCRGESSAIWERSRHKMDEWFTSNQILFPSCGFQIFLRRGKRVLLRIL